MLKPWLSRLEPVHRAETREEREAVYRFRYEVYFKEFGRELGSPDHDRRWVTDADDEKDTSTILYTGSLDRITGTVRVRHWRAGEVPHHDFEELSMDRFSDIETRNTGEIGRLMVRPSMRGKLVLASLLRASYHAFAGEQETDLVFCYCSPGLVRYYQHLAMRPFGGRLVAAPDGMMLPMVAVLSDHAYYRSTGSFLAPLVKRYFGPGKRCPLDPEAYRGIFAPGATGIEFEPERVRQQVTERLFNNGVRSVFLDSLPSAALGPLLGQGLIIDVAAGTLVTRKGFHEREMFVVLDGRFELGDDGRRLERMERGELFGEDAFLHPDGRRRASVRALENGRLLVLPGRAVEKLIRRDPALAASLLRQIGGVVVERLASVRSSVPALA